MNGLTTALATPFVNGKICYRSLEKLLDFQMLHDVTSFVVAGTTGESTLLSHREKINLLRFCRSSLDGCTLIAGISSPSTDQAVKQAVYATAEGADALLVSPPYYSKCTEEGYVRHIESICKCTSLPVILYNVPLRSGYCLTLRQIGGCRKFPNVTHVKQCVNVEKAKQLSVDGIDVLCGDDALLPQYIESLSAKGAISVISNLFPTLTAQVMNGKHSDVYQNCVNLLAKEVNPTMIKYLLYKAGFISSPEVRLPLTLPDEKLQKEADEFIALSGGVM